MTTESATTPIPEASSVGRLIGQPWSEKTDALLPALATAQAAFPSVTKTAENPQFRSKYADLGAIWEAIRGSLADNGLVIVHSQIGMLLETYLIHAPSGQWMRTQFPLKPTKPGPQPLGSEITYARRYSLCSLLAIATEDDDGEGAEGRSGASSGRAPTKGNVGAEKPVETISSADCVQLQSKLVEACNGDLDQTTKRRDYLMRHCGVGELAKIPADMLDRCYAYLDEVAAQQDVPQ